MKSQFNKGSPRVYDLAEILSQTDKDGAYDSVSMSEYPVDPTSKFKLRIYFL